MAQAIATVCVAIIGLIGIIIQTMTNSKLERQDKLVKTIDEKIEASRKESKNDDKKLNAKLDNIRMNELKRFLINEMSKIRDKNYIPNEEQKRLIHEAKQEYNELGRG